MKTTLILISLLSTSFVFAQKDFKISELNQRFRNSVLQKDNTELTNEAINESVKQYICLNKNYKIKFNQQAAFLTEKEFRKKYRKEIGKDLNYLEPLAEKKDFMYSLMMSNYDFRMAVQKNYSKCISVEDVNF